ncbi:SDR family NAD(P)-dependent oxidoreductase [Roseivirga sp. BDSF3-8]|uniref:SDR family NAD(P)-dependent oxidoreductase n=1 Tax=Roseivirga sp. BDSF3-8 TaxID=3241598 RepID=UPI0035325DCA
MTKIAFITGATSGIGLATARDLAKNNYNLIVCGRRSERLNALKDELKGQAEVYPLTFDVRDREAVEEAIAGLPAKWQEIDVLVNNAGNAHGLDPIQEGSIDDWEAMIDINVKGLLYVSRAIIPGMVERRKGHIVNIGSLAGKEVYPRGNVYSATKHAVDALNKGMRIDLNGHGIKVTAINPGLVETEFSEVRFKGDKDRAGQVYQGYKALEAEDIAEIITFTVTRPPHVVMSDVLILPLAQASSTLVNKE